MDSIPIYSFVAFSGTGKTTLLEKLVPILKQKGLRVAVIKHDSHDFEIDHEGKDSWRMTQAGADVTVISSSAKTAIMENRFVSMDTLLPRILNVDLILTEGYKHGRWPKLGILREGAEQLPLPEAAFAAIISDLPLDTAKPVLPLNAPEIVADWILADMSEWNCSNPEKRSGC